VQAIAAKTCAGGRVRAKDGDHGKPAAGVSWLCRSIDRHRCRDGGKQRLQDDVREPAWNIESHSVPGTRGDGLSDAIAEIATLSSRVTRTAWPPVADALSVGIVTV